MKRTRLKYQAANEFGTVLSKVDDYSLTSDNILKEGNQFIKLSSTTILTLPAAELDLKGIVVRVFASDASSKVVVAAGFGGGGSAYDTVSIGQYETVDFWCDGSYWYAQSSHVAAS